MKYAVQHLHKRIQWAGFHPLKQSVELLMRRAKSSTSGIVSCSLFCKHGPDYIGATIRVIHTKSIQGR